jgi:flagellin-like hook-associated protein FlgL
MSTIDGPVGSHQAGLLGVLIARSTDIRQRLDRLNIQAGSGKVAQEYAGLGAGAATSLDLRTSLTTLSGWQGNIDAATTRMAVARGALGGIEAIAAKLLARLPDLNGLNRQAIDAVAAEARLALTQVGDLLNSQAAGAYVFAGEDSANAPVPDPVALPTSGFYQQIAAAVGDLATDGAAATAAATLAVAASNADGTSPFSAHLSQSAGALATPVVEVGPGQRIRTGLLASANAAVASLGDSTTGSYMRDLMRALATVGSLSSTQADAAGFAALVADTRVSLNGAIDAMAADVGVLGDTEATLAAIRTRHGDTEVALTAQLGRLEDVDMAQTLARLSQVETQLQLSYRLISSSNNLSLVKFLGST